MASLKTESTFLIIKLDLNKEKFSIVIIATIKKICFLIFHYILDFFNIKYLWYLSVLLCKNIKTAAIILILSVQSCQVVVNKNWLIYFIIKIIKYRTLLYFASANVMRKQKI